MTCKDLIVNGIARIVGKIYSAGGFVGNLTGDVTGNCSGSSSSCTGTAENAKTVNNLTVQTAVPTNAVFTDTKAASSLTCTSGTYGGSSATTSVQGALNNLTSGLNGKVGYGTYTKITPTVTCTYGNNYTSASVEGAYFVSNEIYGYEHYHTIIKLTPNNPWVYAKSGTFTITLPTGLLGYKTPATGEWTTVGITRYCPSGVDHSGLECAYYLDAPNASQTNPALYTLVFRGYNRNSGTSWSVGGYFYFMIDYYRKSS